MTSHGAITRAIRGSKATKRSSTVSYTHLDVYKRQAQEKKDQTKAGVEDLKKEEIEIETQVLQIRKEKEETKQELERSEARCV